MPDTLWFIKDGKKLQDVELRNGRANPFGWSTHEVWLTEHGGETLVEYKIADLYCGSPINLIEGITFEIEKGTTSE